MKFPPHAARGTVSPVIVRHPAMVCLPSTVFFSVISIAVIGLYRIDRSTHERNLETLRDAGALAASSHATEAVLGGEGSAPVSGMFQAPIGKPASDGNAMVPSMSSALQQDMTREMFLAWEEQQPLRYEFDGSQPIAMAGGTAAHSAIQLNLLVALRVGLRGKPCRPHGSELKVRVADRPVRYPDAFVVCTPVPPRATMISDPVVVFEVFSEGSATEDFIVKNAEYRATPSIRRYVVLQQTRAAAVVFSRKGEDWVTDLLTGADAVLRMPEIDLDVPLSEIYADVELEVPVTSPADP